VEYSLVTRGAGGLFNDFYDYWGAGVLLNRGQNPYDVPALAAVQRAAGLHVESGSGYSYPLFFAHLLRPLALFDPRTAALIFSALSLVALAAAIAILLGSIPVLSWPVSLLGGAAAGIFPAVNGSLYFGQANLIVQTVDFSDRNLTLQNDSLRAGHRENEHLTRIYRADRTLLYDDNPRELTPELTDAVRQALDGVPITVFRHKETGEVIPSGKFAKSKELISRIAKAFALDGADVAFGIIFPGEVLLG